MAELHEAFIEHPHIKTVWVNEATGEWHIHPKKGCITLSRGEDGEEPKAVAKKKKK